MKKVEILNVFYSPKNSIKVGRIALVDRKIYFEYEEEFLQHNIHLSPFHLPNKKGLFGGPDFFEFLPGLFNDSLPDGWGRLLLDRKLISNGVSFRNLSPLDRLAYVGCNGMGALSYKPEILDDLYNVLNFDIDQFASQSLKILEGDTSLFLDELVRLNGSSQGARPKILVAVSKDKNKIISTENNNSPNYENWIIKFPNSSDPQDIGRIEYGYYLLALKAGVEMMPSHLFISAKRKSYFGANRFDRVGDERIHVHSASGLLHADHRVPSLDYDGLLKACRVLTKKETEVEKFFRLAVFNVFASNRDDHSKNFSFLMDQNGEWRLSPAFDLTWSTGPGGEHSTTVMGEGKNPGKKELLKLAESQSLSKQFALRCIEEVREAVSGWTVIAKELDIKTKIDLGKNLL